MPAQIPLYILGRGAEIVAADVVDVLDRGARHHAVSGAGGFLGRAEIIAADEVRIAIDTLDPGDLIRVVAGRQERITGTGRAEEG